jgi:peptidoglycan hydrolase-like protein with peptidoglycan-binding domain
VTREKIKGEKEVVKLNVEKYNFTNYLTIGSHGDEVRALQVILKDLGYFEYMHVSGMYGPITKAAVTKFQKDHSITPATGSVGPKTRDLLNALE